MRILVTGATGFIGREIVSELEKFNVEIFQVGGEKQPVGEQGKIYRVDIRDYENFSDLKKLNKLDVVIHAAGLAHQFKEIAREKFEAVNVQGTRNAAKLAVELKAERFILISSTAVYGTKKFSNPKSDDWQALKIDENTICQPETLYAESKLQAERAARAICEENNINLTILRLAPVIGEGNYAANTARLIAAIDKKRFVWIGKGENFKTLIYKNDVARACRAAALRNLYENGAGKTEIFNLADKPVKMKELVETIAAGLEKSILPIHINPAFLELIFKVNSKLSGIKKIENLSKTIEKWLSDDVYDTEKISRLYNFEPETPTKEAIKKQVEWYKSQNKRL